MSFSASRLVWIAYQKPIFPTSRNHSSFKTELNSEPDFLFQFSVPLIVSSFFTKKCISGATCTLWRRPTIDIDKGYLGGFITLVKIFLSGDEKMTNLVEFLVIFLVSFLHFTSY